MDMEGLAAVIRNSRLAKRMTQAELGRRVGLSRASISLLECGRYKNPYLPLLDRISDTLDIPRAVLWGKMGVDQILVPEADATSLPLDTFSVTLKGGRKVELNVIGGKLRGADIEALKVWLDWQATQLDDDSGAQGPSAGI